MARQFGRQPQQQAPQQPPQQAPQNNAHPGEQANPKRGPVMSFKTMVGSTSIECAIWLNEAQGQDGSSYNQYSVTLTRSYVDQKGVWHSEKDGKKQSFRPQELPVAVFLLNKSFEWILSEKTTCPI